MSARKSHQRLKIMVGDRRLELRTSCMSNGIDRFFGVVSNFLISKKL